MGGSESKGPVPRPLRPKEVPYEKLLDAQRRIQIDPVNCYNYAVVGNSGAGKSSLINALRGIRSSDPWGAKVGVGETTTICTKYNHPNVDYIKIWDVPGASNATCTAANYFEHFSLFCYDGVIIVTAERILETDIEIAKSALDNNIKCIFVRSKSDASVMNWLRDEDLEDEEDKSSPLSHDLEEEVRSKLNDVMEGMRRILVKQPNFDGKVYLVSSQMILAVMQPENKKKISKYVLQFDEKELLETLANCAGARLDEKDRVWQNLSGSYEDRIRQLGRIRTTQN